MPPVERVAALVGLGLLTAIPATMAAEALITNQGSDELSVVDLDMMASVATAGSRRDAVLSPPATRSSPAGTPARSACSPPAA